MPPLSMSHPEDANMDIHMTPQNTLPDDSMVLGQQRKALGSEQQRLRLHRRMSQASFTAHSLASR